MLQTNFEHMKQVIPKKNFEYFSMYFYGSNPGTLGQGRFGPWDLHFNTFGTGQIGNAI